ncbi:hypothetical protein ACHAXS_002469 [Conticribra weissflogii]
MRISTSSEQCHFANQSERRNKANVAFSYIPPGLIGRGRSKTDELDKAGKAKFDSRVEDLDLDDIRGCRLILRLGDG